MPLVRLGDRAPETPAEGRYWIAPNATVIGAVRLGEDASVWFGTVIRGDNEPIAIGARSNVQDLCVIHTDPGFPATIGEGSTIGHRAILHGCTIGDNSLVGMGAIVMNGTNIGRNCLIGAGALVPEGMEVPDNSLVIGAPGKVVRTLGAEAAAAISGAAERYAANWKRYLISS